MMLSSFLGFFVATALLGPEDWYVDAGANCGVGEGTADRPYCTVQEAVDAALDGDRILIAPGLYVENLSFSKSLTFEATAGFEATTIRSAPSGGWVFGPGGGTSTVLRGLTIEEGTSSGVSVNSSQPSRLELWSCRVRRNKNIAGVAQGGGIYTRNADVLLVDTQILENVCDPWLFAPYPDGFGAGLYVSGGSLTLDGCTVANNLNQGRCVAAGGGILAANAEVVIRDSVIERNVLGGIAVGEGGGIFSGGTGSLRIERSVIRSNSSNKASGLSVTHAFVLEDVEVTGNSSSSFGATLAIRGVAGSLRNTTIVTSGLGDVIDLEVGASVDVESSILWRLNGTTPAITGKASALAASTVNHSNVFGGWAGTGAGNIDLPPGFQDTTTDDYRLLLGSPCIDTGDPSFLSSGKDAGGVGRLMDGDLDNMLAVDMGAHEATHLTLSVVGNLSPGAALTIDVAGSPNIVASFVGISPAPSNGFLVGRFGSLFFDPTAPFQTLVLGPPPTSTMVVAPPSLPAGLTVVFQGIGFAAPTMGAAPGNFSNAVARGG